MSVFDASVWAIRFDGTPPSPTIIQIHKDRQWQSIESVRNWVSLYFKNLFLTILFMPCLLSDATAILWCCLQWRSTNRTGQQRGKGQVGETSREQSEGQTVNEPKTIDDRHASQVAARQRRAHGASEQTELAALKAEREELRQCLSSFQTTKRDSSYWIDKAMTLLSK